jgi:hypothetical protein
MSTLMRALSWLLALLGAALAYAVVSGHLPPELARRSLRMKAHDDGAACCESHSDAAPHVSPAAAVTASPGRAAPTLEAPRGQRFALCEREEARVSSNELQLREQGPPLLAIGCGSSVQVLGFERVGALIEPRRLLELRLEPHSPAEAPYAIEALAADLDGDGRRDLLASVLLVDAAGSPRGGGLFVSAQRAEGGFAPARRLLELAPVDVAVAGLDSARGQDLVLLHGGDPRLARPSALWLVSGGPAPVRVAVREASVGSRAVVACDLDGDGLDELIEAGGEDGVLRLWPSGVSPSAQPRTLAAKHARELLCVHDGKSGGAGTVAVLGEQLALLRAQPGTDPELLPVAESANLRSLRALDLDGDGVRELIGYEHPALVAFTRRGEAFERRVLATLAGQASVLDAQLLRLSDAAAPALLVLTISNGAVEVSVLADLALGSTVELPASSVPVPSGALLQRVALR